MPRIARAAALRERFRAEAGCDVVDIVGQILIRHLDDAVIQRLKERGRHRKTSAEAEARQAPTASVSFDREAVIARRDAIAKANQPQAGPTSCGR